MGGSVSHALARQPIGLITHLCHRICLEREMRARTAAWQRWEPSLPPGSHQAPPLDLPPRPSALPDGPVERVANWSALLALGGYGGVLATSRSPQRALGVLHAGVPRAAKVGRDSFAAQLDTDLCRRGGIVLDHDVLRRLDRVDTVILDSGVLLSGRQVIADVVRVDPGADRAELIERAHDLVDLRQPGTRRQRTGWVIEPLDEPPPDLPDTVAATAAEQTHRGAQLLALRHHDRLLGLVSVAAELDPLAEALVGAARSAGPVLLGGPRRGLVPRLRLDAAVPGGTGLSAAVGAQQTEGRVVAVVSSRNDAALAAADVGIGLPTRAGSADAAAAGPGALGGAGAVRGSGPGLPAAGRRRVGPHRQYPRRCALPRRIGGSGAARRTRSRGGSRGAGIVSDEPGGTAVEELSPWLRLVLATAVRASPWQVDEDQVPHQTDRAVLAGARRAGVAASEGFDEVAPITELQFEPSRGYHATLWRDRSGYRVSVKGGPESVLSRCSSWRTPDGVVRLDLRARQAITGEVDRLAGQGYRVLAIAERAASQRPELDEARITDLEFCGLVALADPVRPTAAQAVCQLQAAGVEIMMITGDHPGTAESIAATATAGAAGLAWLLTRMVATSGQAGTTALVALVGAQLGQTIAVRGRSRLVVAAGVGSFLALGAAVALPGVSHFFGCRPLLPHQWGIGLSAAAVATGVALLAQ